MQSMNMVGGMSTAQSIGGMGMASGAMIGAGATTQKNKKKIGGKCRI